MVSCKKFRIVLINKFSFLENKVIGHDEYEKNNAQYLETNDGLLCPMIYRPRFPLNDQEMQTNHVCNNYVLSQCIFTGC